MTNNNIEIELSNLSVDQKIARLMEDIKDLSVRQCVISETVNTNKKMLCEIIKYVDEVIRRKAGKALKGAQAPG